MYFTQCSAGVVALIAQDKSVSGKTLKLCRRKEVNVLKVLHLSDIHMGSGFSHGQINPATGLNTRLEDFVKALRLCIDRAIAEPADLVLFGGDAFPDATPAPYVQEVFAAEFRRLADANIPTVLLVGNHDQHSQGIGGASLCIYRTLAVPGFIVGDRLETHLIPTANGDIQVVTLPWLTRSTLLTRPETEGLSLEGVNALLLKKLEPILEAEVRALDPHLPTILLAHVMADRATFGAEKFLAVGKGFTIPLALFVRPEFDYVALGHVHKHQNLNPDNNPPAVYPGSIERVDFGEEKEEKGYVWLEIKRGKVDWQFCPLPARPFKTVKVDVTAAADPQAAILGAIAAANLNDAVVRLLYQIRSEQLEHVDNRALQAALTPCHSYTIKPELASQLTRRHLPELSSEAVLDPLAALRTYLDNREDIQALKPDLLAAADHLLTQDTESGWVEA
ncbi:MAG: hypothetical protein RLZZ568_911 [Cyanobacteriota bacterium]|jgi:exonuclease SbcD